MNEMIEPEGNESKQPEANPEIALTPAAPQSDGGEKGEEKVDQRRRRAKPQLPTEEGSLAALNALSGMTLMGLVGVPQANAIRGIHSTILQHLGRKQGGADSLRIDAPGLAEIVSKHPELAAQLEPLLSDEQIAVLMRQTSEG